MVIPAQAWGLVYKKGPSNKPVDFPVIYRPEYNISFGPLDYLHKFDGSKYGHVAEKIANYVRMPMREEEQKSGHRPSVS